MRDREGLGDAIIVPTARSAAKPACHTELMPTLETIAALSEVDVESEFLAAWRLAQMDSPRPDLGQDTAWTNAVRDLHPGVFALRVLRQEACARLLRQIDMAREREFERGGRLSVPNSMHRHGVLIGALGFDALLADLTTRWVRPIAAHVLPQFNGATLNSYHGYLFEYARDKDERLAFHVDDSDVTFNLCLSDSFEGAELKMLGLRCDLHRDTEVLPGARRNLILWCRDATRRSAPSRLALWRVRPGAPGAHGVPRQREASQAQYLRKHVWHTGTVRSPTTCSCPPTPMRRVSYWPEGLMVDDA